MKYRATVVEEALKAMDVAYALARQELAAELPGLLVGGEDGWEASDDGMHDTISNALYRVNESVVKSLEENGVTRI